MDNFPRLNLPALVAPRLRRDGDMVRIYDVCRNAYVKLTPEEWVRQHFVGYLCGELGYRPSIIGNEVSLRLNGLSRRADTVVYDAHGEPYIIVEYKAPHVEITQQVFDQIVRYNMVLRARYLAVSNGLRHYCCAIDYATKSYKFIPQLPAYGG
ncbi:MAG: type I restriction enzyme HsdR N-terminal domain-containing protein [Muribaculaceae bacterium]|nr:type I restriction enzyme HsdR N-terminal domain-containing protein [Muribaculaceae bacterium]